MAYELFFDGFEHYSNTADVMLYGYMQANGSISANGGRRGGKCFIGPNWSGQGLFKTCAASSHVVAGFAIKNTTSASVIFLNGGTAHGVLTLTPTGYPTLTVGGATTLTATTIWLPNIWNFVELGLSVANAGGLYEVRVNGSNVGWIPAGTGDTQSGATTTIDNVRFVSNQGSGAFFAVDDFYLTFGDELKWLGDSRIDKLLLTANALPQDWTPDSGNAWERLNAGTGYIASSVDEATSLFEFADLPYTPQSVHGLSLRSALLKNNTNFRSATALIRSGATEQEGTELALSTDALGHTLILPKNPATNMPWDFASIAAAQAGVRVKG